MAELSYYKERDQKNIQKLREIIPTLPGFCREYFLSLEISKASSTRLNYASDLEIFFYFLQQANPLYKDKKLTLEDLSHITVIDIEEYMSFLSSYDKDGIHYTNDARGKARKLAALRSLYNYFVKRQFLENNPAALVDTPSIKDDSKQIIYLELHEVAELVDQVESGEKLTKKQQESYKKTRLRDIAIIILLLGTGIRVSECVGLNLEDIDLVNAGINVTRKGGRKETVPIGYEVQEALTDYLELQRQHIIPEAGSENAVFISLNNTRITTRSVERLVKKYASLVTTLKKITPHKLRSTHGTNLYLETGDIYLVSDRLGHKNVNTTQKHYTAQTAENRARGANAVPLHRTET